MENEQTLAFPDRIEWSSTSHERTLDRFYGIGVENYGEYHHGYLNFGLWTNGADRYLAAAENLVRTLAKMGDTNAESRMLDVACGMGTQDVLIAKEFGAHVDALDVTWKHVQQSQARVKREGVADHVTVHHGTAVKLPFENDTFTQVQSIEGAEHFDTREAFFKEALRVLKSGGKIMLCDYVMTRWPKKWWEKFVVDFAAKMWCVPRANYETIESYKTRLEQCGFKNVVVNCVGKDTIPPYYFEARKPENLKEQRKIRGWFAILLSFFVDYSVYKAFTTGMVEYVMVKGEK